MATTTPTITVAGQLLDPCQVVLPLTITVGRSGIAYQPDPPTCTLSFRGSELPFGERDPITVTLDPGLTDTAGWVDPTAGWLDPAFSWLGDQLPVNRFVGQVNGCRAIESRGGVKRWEVRARGRSVQLGRTPFLANFYESTDFFRVRAISNGTGYPIAIKGHQQTNMAPVEVDSSAMEALNQVTTSTGALAWEDQDGQLWYGAPDHRIVPASAVLPTCALIDGIDWLRNPDEIINAVTITYGPPDARVEATIVDQPSIDRYDRQHIGIDTQLATRLDADALGATIMLRRRAPWWAAQGVLIYSDQIAEPTDWWAVNRLHVGDAVLLPIPPDPGVVPAAPHSWTVEGWQEVWDTPTRQRIQLALSDQQRWGVTALRNWGEVRDGGSWGDWAAGSWLDQLNKVGAAP